MSRGFLQFISVALANNILKHFPFRKNWELQANNSIVFFAEMTRKKMFRTTNGKFTRNEHLAVDPVTTFDAPPDDVDPDKKYRIGDIEVPRTVVVAQVEKAFSQCYTKRSDPLQCVFTNYGNNRSRKDPCRRVSPTVNGKVVHIPLVRLIFAYYDMAPIPDFPASKSGGTGLQASHRCHNRQEGCILCWGDNPHVIAELPALNNKRKGCLGPIGKGLCTCGISPCCLISTTL